MNTHDKVTRGGAPDVPAQQSNTADTVELSSDQGLDDFPSESEGSFELATTTPTLQLPWDETAAVHLHPIPYVARDSHYGRALAAGAGAVLLVLVVTGLLLRTLSGGDRTVSALPAEVLGGQPSLKSEDSPRLEVTGAALPADDSAAGVVRHAPGTDTPTASVKSATSVRRPRSGVSRTSQRETVPGRAAGRHSTRGDQLFRGTSGVVTPQPRAAAPAAAVIAANNPADDRRAAPVSEQHQAERQAPAMGPAMTARETAAPDSAQVSVTTSNSDSDELMFSWSAPVGRFADATASQTRFFCPQTPQQVEITVLVTDGKGAAGSDRITVHCVASTR